MPPCAECKGPALAYCVDLNKVYCRKCVGRCFHPSLPTANLTLEELDNTRGPVLAVTKIIMYLSVSVGAVFCLWNAGIGEDYFKGASICPTLSVFRQALARFDANAFYYYKPSLATYCDTEDSFWRLLMDGWVRGIVSGSDSILLLGTTLPKAWLFKVAVSTFLQPIYTMIYAIVGLTLSFVLLELDDGSHWIFQHLPFVKAKKKQAAQSDSSSTAESATPKAKAKAAANAAASSPAAASGAGKAVDKAAVKTLGSRLRKLLRDVFSLPQMVMVKAKTKSTFFDTAWQLFVALGLSGVLRLAVHHAGYDKLAALGSPKEVNLWQLVFEPVCFFYMASLCTQVNMKLGKTLWKKAVPNAIAPMTFRTMKPHKDVTEAINYNRSRVTRTYNNYKTEAQGLLNFFVDEIFNTVIVLRLLGVLIHAAPIVRKVLSHVGLGPLIARHRQWFLDSTGFMDTDSTARYVSDRLLSFGFKEFFLGFSFVTHGIVEEAEDLVDFSGFGVLHFLHQVSWRVLVPLLLWWLETKWQGYLKRQGQEFTKKWKGTDWTNGEYADMLEKYGSYWMEVPRDQWAPAPAPGAK